MVLPETVKQRSKNTRIACAHLIPVTKIEVPPFGADSPEAGFGEHVTQQSAIRDLGAAKIAVRKKAILQLGVGFLAHGDLNATQVANRRLLRDVLTESGFRGIGTEWWHFDFGDRDKVRAAYPRVL